jgi:hypothetical protein
MRLTLLLGVAVCALALAVRVPVLLRIPEASWRGLETERVAASLLRGDGWSDAFGPGTGPTAHVAPLYPALLCGVYRLWGTYETPAGRLAQQCLSLAVALAVLLALPALARRLGLSVGAGWAAAFLAAWLPANVWDQVTGHQEQGMAALALLGLLGACAGLRQGGWSGRGRILTAGALLGVVALLCPNLLAAPALFFLASLARRRGERRQILRCGLALAGVCLAFVAPWAVRNYLVLGGFVPLRSNLGLELAVGNRPGADGYSYAPGFSELHPWSNAAERARLVRVGELAYMAQQRRRALAWIADNPARFARLTLRRASLFWFFPDEHWASLELRLRLTLRVYGLLGLAALAELARLLRRGHRSGGLLACALLGVSLPYFVTHVEMRYRLPVVTVQALLACDLAAAAVRRLCGRRSRQAPPAEEGDIRPQARAA